MNPANEFLTRQTRRAFLGKSTMGLGSVALGTLLNAGGKDLTGAGLSPGLPHFAPRAKRVIYLFQNGAPTHCCKQAATLYRPIGVLKEAFACVGGFTPSPMARPPHNHQLI